MLGAFVLHVVLAPPLQAAEPRNVLVLYSQNRLVPGNVAVDRGLRAGLATSDERPVAVFSEFLDRPDFGGDAYEDTVTRYLREKYAARPPDAVVVVNDSALDFWLRHREQLFGRTPVVHAVVSRSYLASLPKLPADVIGVPMEYDFAGTIEQALRWHPDAGKLVIVTGRSDRDREWEARLRREVPRVAGKVPVEFVSGLSTADITSRLRALDPDAVVFTPGYYEDGSGRLFNPRDSAGIIAAASAAPVYGPFDTFIGTGVVGGRMPSFEAMGRLAALAINPLLADKQAASPELPAVAPTFVQVDWRQLRRWGIEEDLMPPGAIVHYRAPTFWEAYRNAAIITAAIILLQAALIAALLIERRRRRSAETAVQTQRTELAHASRLAVAGELTASIAHEINQPLGAIQTSADAADLILQSGADRRDDLLRIVTRIRRDNLRASDVIRRLRTLFAKHEPQRQPVDINGALGDAITLLEAEARQRRVVLDLRLLPGPTRLVADVTQLQQVLIILVLNAMDAVESLPDERRIIAVSVERDERMLAIVVRDRGHGILEADLPRVFDSFFTTKPRGMGLGLSIARTIVEAHGGTIVAGNAEGEGAIFRVEFPVAGDA